MTITEEARDLGADIGDATASVAGQATELVYEGAANVLAEGRSRRGAAALLALIALVAVAAAVVEVARRQRRDPSGADDPDDGSSPSGHRSGRGTEATGPPSTRTASASST